MAKQLHPLLDPDGNLWPFWTVLDHEGGPPWDPTARHYCWAYPLDITPPNTAAISGHSTIVEALAEARAWAALPLIPRGLCIWCRALAWGPSVPRWNAYQGENLMIVPSTLYWDILLGPPP